MSVDVPKKKPYIPPAVVRGYWMWERRSNGPARQEEAHIPPPPKPPKPQVITFRDGGGGFALVIPALALALIALLIQLLGGE